MKKIVFVSLVVFSIFLLTSPAVVFSGGILDGKQFDTHLDGDNDILTFQDGMFHSLSCDKWGFGLGEYSTTASGNSISFKATTTSEKHGIMVWKGTVIEAKIEGSYYWRKKGLFGTETKTMSFGGIIKK